MTKEQVKNILAFYEEVYSYKELANMTGYSVDELRLIYDELFENKELEKRKKAMHKLNRYQGVWRIDPVTFSCFKYDEMHLLKEDGYYAPNVFSACKRKSALVGGYMWRFGIDVDGNNIKKSVMSANPELFVPLIATDLITGEKTRYSTLQVAHALGFDKRGVMGVLNGKKKSYKGYVWSIDTSAPISYSSSNRKG